MISPTVQQIKILDYLKRFFAEHHQSPTYSQIRIEFGFKSISAAQKHIFYMGKKGLVHKPHGAHKRITITAIPHGQSQT